MKKEEKETEITQLLIGFCNKEELEKLDEERLRGYQADLDRAKNRISEREDEVEYIINKRLLLQAIKYLKEELESDKLEYWQAGRVRREIGEMFSKYGL